MLRDGSRIHVRPIEPDDRDGLVAAFERLSPEARYRRFFGPVKRLSSRDLDFLTRVDHHDHEALVAVDPDTREGVGVARYVRTGDGVAEPAMVVADDWQGRGVARVLLDRLAGRAVAAGVHRFDAPVLADNPGAIRALERLGATSIRRNGREVELKIELPDQRSPDEPAQRLLPAFASGVLEPARTLFGWIWPRRRGAPGDARRNLIVVGTDGSEHASDAVAVAAGLARASDAILHVVGVHPFLPTAQAERAEVVHRTAGDLRREGLHVHAVVRRGDPAYVLTDVAADERARLVVVGAGRRGQAARRLLGGVADHVAERAPCDVLIVRRG
jgi:nucleotide-binding universal stress UspA family protein/GNAT superfamily N-acetyltransferase